MLRKERGFSQKKVSEDQHISQALLSHYEKGIRECGLEFVVHAADYFGVSCDFLLGRSDRREMNRGENPSKATGTSKQPAVLNSAVIIVFGILKKINSKSLTQEVTHYFRAAVYTIFRLLYSANELNEKNAKEIFSLRSDLYPTVADAQMSVSLAKCRSMLCGAGSDGDTPIKQEDIPVLSREILAGEFSKHSPALFDLIENAEKQNF